MLLDLAATSAVDVEAKDELGCTPQEPTATGVSVQAKHYCSCKSQ
jgi:hypothetical protein